MSKPKSTLSKPITYEIRIDYRYAHKRAYTNTAIYRSREQDVYGILSTFAQHIWMERAKTVTVNCIDGDSYIVDIVPNQPCYVQAVRIYIRRPMSDVTNG